MAIKTLRSKVIGMDVNDTIQVPRDYEETTIRNYASAIGALMNRKYQVTKMVPKKQYVITRIS